MLYIEKSNLKIWKSEDEKWDVIFLSYLEEL